MLFSDAVIEYMADKGKRLRATTLEGYRSAIRCHLMPMWGGREIETISFEEVQDWVDGFTLPGAAEKAYKTFRQIYRWVLRRHQLRIWDVTRGVELPTKPAVRRPTLSADQERTTLRAIVGQPFEPAVLLGATLGLRRCEACAVRIEDIDWRSGWVHVQRGLHVVKGEVIETGCKTKLSDRRLKLPRFALERLRAIRGAQVRQALPAGSEHRGQEVRRVLQTARTPPRPHDVPEAQLGNDIAGKRRGDRRYRRRPRPHDRQYGDESLPAVIPHSGGQSQRYVRNRDGTVIPYPCFPMECQEITVRSASHSALPTERSRSS